MVDASRIRPYGLAPVFERIIAQHCAASSKFWGRAGQYVDPEAMGDEPSKLVVRACVSIAQELGSPPRSAAVVAQRLHRWREQGKSTADEVRKACNVLEAAEDNVGGDVDENAIVIELVPVLKRRLQKVALEGALIDYGKQGDLSHFTDMISKSAKIGAVDTATLGTRLTSASFGSMLEHRKAKHIDIGIPELDAVIGGVPVSTFSVILAATNGGKSMLLSHHAAECLSNKMSVAYASTELQIERLQARIVGNLVDLPTEDILRYSDVGKLAAQRLKALEEDGILGFFACQHFTSGLSTVDDILAWKAAEEAERGQHIQVVLVDSVNDLVVAGSKAPRHEQQEKAARQMRDRANTTEDEWWWTSAQADAQGMDTKTKRIENHNAAFSKGISRAAELLISLNPRDEGLMYYVAKNTHGDGGQEVGPLAKDCAFGRIAPVHRTGWPW